VKVSLNCVWSLWSCIKCETKYFTILDLYLFFIELTIHIENSGHFTLTLSIGLLQIWHTGKDDERTGGHDEHYIPPIF
jgi:hypothetical protein